jgi:hypothetical protein
MSNRPDLFALVSPEDYDTVCYFTWHATYRSGSKTFYAYTELPEWNGRTIRLAMHELVANPTSEPGMEVHHGPDHDGLNNTRENLTRCTRAEHKRLHREVHRSPEHKNLNICTKWPREPKPRGMKTDRTEVMSIRMSARMMKKLRAVARERDWSTATAIREGVRRLTEETEHA